MATAKKTKATGKKSTGGNDLAGKVQAIDRAQAVIEFTLDGTILTANENFLKTLGYALDEVKDKHHRMFCESAYSNSPEYQAFWDKLKRGESHTGVHKCLAKGGKEVWMQATCTPVLGADGRPTKAIELATDMTALRLELDDMREELKARTDIMNQTSIVSEADLKGDIVWVNDKFCEVSKYPKNELVGKGHNTTRHPDMPKEAFKDLWGTIGRGQIWRGVVKNRAKDGTPYYVDAVIAPFIGKNGKPRKYLGVRYDITVQEIARQNMKGMADAIDKAYATIEFDLKGIILTANNVFLQTTGYSLDEIKGKHHSMFVEPSYSGSPEYRAFWEKLGRGESEAGQYKRLVKGGKEIWLQAGYNPIMDEMGRTFKVLKLASDITTQKKAQVELEACMAEAQQSLSALAEGDLTQEMHGSYQGELEKIKTSINAALTNLTHTMTNVRDAVESVTAGSEQITKGSEDLSQRTAEQASALEETSASMEEMTSTVKQNADNAKQANQLAIAARDIADKGGAVTTKAVEAMGEINKSSKKIADIITVIDEIAFQTNLLALNAAVEAARAGEHGRGFAVVAAEVRNLAQRSATAAKEIKGLINESIQRVSDGTSLVDQSGKTLGEIVSSVKRVTDIIAEITAASQEQASGIDQVNKAIMQMDEATQQNAALVEETTSASQSMKEQAQELMRQVEVFKTNGTSETSHVKREAPTSRRASDSGTKLASRTTVHATPKPMVKKPLAGGKPAEVKEPVGVAAGNGKERRHKEAEFEEF
jgi:methyl-accepting chemotaxis protein